MIAKLLIAWCLLALTVTIHAAGLSALVGLMLPSSGAPDTRVWRLAWQLIRVAWWLVLLHLAEIAVWALYYWWQQYLPDVESALYFSGVTYTTLGYGDLTLPKNSRLLGAIEGLSGILMCGLSTGFFFAMGSRLYTERASTRQT